MKDGTANGGSGWNVTASTSGDDDGLDQNENADLSRLHRRAVFLGELDNARRLIARAREVDHTLVLRELVGRRSIARSR